MVDVMDGVWNTTDAKALIKALIPGGNCYGKSDFLARLLTLHKTDLIADLRRERSGAQFIWKIIGDASQSGKYAPNRRSVVLWLGK